MALGLFSRNGRWFILDHWFEKYSWEIQNIGDWKNDMR